MSYRVLGLVLCGALLNQGCFLSNWMGKKTGLASDQDRDAPGGDGHGEGQESQVRDPELFWLSLDALNPKALEPYLPFIRTPHARGLVWLLNQTHANPALQVPTPSITAPSHISTMTCAAAGSHGVFNNSRNWTGTTDLVGFSMPYKTETWVQALRRTGKRVAVIAYPSVDGQTPERSPDIGVAYDNPTGKIQYIPVHPDMPEQPVEVAGRADAAVIDKFTLKYANATTLTVSNAAGEAKELPVGQPVDEVFTEGLDGAKHKVEVSFMNLGVQGGAPIVEVSPVSIMPTTGLTLHKRLDDKNILFSNLKDKGLSNYPNGVDLMIGALRHRHRALIAAAREMLVMGQSDAFFMYLEDIDSLLHAYMGDENLNEKIGTYLAEFDQDLGELLSSLPATTNLVVLGDHGMSLIQYELNVYKLLPPGVVSQFQVRSSGGALYLYPPANLDSSPPANLPTIAESLRNATVEFDGGRKIFRRVILRDSDEARAEGLSGNLSPWLMAFADDGIGFQESVDGALLFSRRASFTMTPEMAAKYPDRLNQGKLIQPVPAGAHGHDSSLAAMRTKLVFVGPKLDAVDMTKVERSLQVVPTVADQLGWQRPASCL